MANHLKKALCGAALAALLAPVPGRAAPCKLRALELPVTMAGLRPLTTVGINGTDVKMLVDSGAFYSMLSDAAAAQLKLPTTHLTGGVRIEGLTGEIETRLADVKRLKLGIGEISDVEFLVGGNELGLGAMGLLGRNVLSYYDTEYDLANGMVRLMIPDGDCSTTVLAYWAAGSTPVSEITFLRERGDKSPAIKGKASLNGKPITVLFDTGAISLVSLDAAKRAGISPDEMTPTDPVRGAGKGQAKGWTAPVKSFEIGGERIANSRLQVGDVEMHDYDMLIGVDFFLSHRIYVSKSQRKIYFTYNGGAVFAMNQVHKADKPATEATEDADAPTDGAGYARRAAAAEARRDYQRALADLDRACVLEPKVASHFARRAAVQLSLSQPDKALPDFDEALRLDPTDADARLSRARLKLARNDRGAALEDMRTLDKGLPSQSHLRFDLGNLYSRMELYDQALPQMNQWIAARPNDANLPRALNERCWARAMLGIELDKALADCNAAIKGEPENANYLDSRAWVRVRQGRWHDAITDFDSALKLRPESPWSLFGRGLTLLSVGEGARGQADIDAARKLRPSIDEDAGRRGIKLP